MLEMLRTEVIPATVEYSMVVAQAINQKKQASLSLSCIAQTRLLEKSDRLINEILSQLPNLDALLEEAHQIKDSSTQAKFYSTKILGKMSEIRASVDALEAITSKKYWPYPSNEDLLFSV